MAEYPIFVERYDSKHPADRAICLGSCGREWAYDPERGDPYDLCLECRCGGAVTFKYAVADKCPGCETLGYFDHKVLGGCCSRKCALQVEYAQSLAKP